VLLCVQESSVAQLQVFIQISSFVDIFESPSSSSDGQCILIYVVDDEQLAVHVDEIVNKVSNSPKTSDEDFYRDVLQPHVLPV